MTPEFYRVVHVAAGLLLFLSLGGVLLGAKDGKPGKMVMALHGIALLLMVVAGVGTVHKDDGLEWGNWLYAKIGCWVFLAIMPVLVKKGVLPRVLGVLLAVAAGAAAVWLAQAKPF